ncbi:uncharacterized protein YALI1_A12822g [Yarrowia lipolytica]|uniref:Uncharacterized protein n=1 Tax=Yarrowia lipolytica TaxID=4952 RepID=A0A1D8N4M4_YARLL|nr:hypothetical protein YALI1_A12822g [Yarrowia lipolytica]
MTHLSLSLHHLGQRTLSGDTSVPGKSEFLLSQQSAMDSVLQSEIDPSLLAESLNAKSSISVLGDQLLWETTLPNGRRIAKSRKEEPDLWVSLPDERNRCWAT